MAESIIVHFRSASAEEVLLRIAAIAEKAAAEQCYYYPSNAGYLLRISVYEDYEGEYEEEAKSELERMLGAQPHGSLVFELRRSRSDDACDAAAKILLELSSEFSFVADDCDRFWSGSEAVSSPQFLDLYRYRKKA